jgi:hypothetical protein
MAERATVALPIFKINLLKGDESKSDQAAEGTSRKS